MEKNQYKCTSCNTPMILGDIDDVYPDLEYIDPQPQSKKKSSFLYSFLDGIFNQKQKKERSRFSDGQSEATLDTTSFNKARL